MRSLVPWLFFIALSSATIWAVSFSGREPADFTFCNATEIKTVDPAIVTGQPEGRVIQAIFEGLSTWHPKTLEPLPAVAENFTYDSKSDRWTFDGLSEDGRVYTFNIRREAKWSDGSPMSADDFVYSFRRFLDPTTPNEYVYQLFYVVNAEKYSKPSMLVPGDPVEIELADPAGDRIGIRGPVVRGKLLQVAVAPGAKTEEDSAGHDHGESSPPPPRIFTVEIDGRVERFQPDAHPGSGVRPCRQVLLDFSQVGIQALDRHTLQITLKSRTPYFLNLVGFYPLFPVNQRCIETHGSPAWTKPQNIVTNGPFILKERRIRDRIRLVKNPHYWNRDDVQLNVVDVLAVESDVTLLNLYEAGLADWIPNVPATAVPLLLAQQQAGLRRDFHPTPEFTIYFYRINVTRPPLNDQRVRQALALAIDRQEIVETITRAGEVPALSFVPPGIVGYQQGKCRPFDPEAARAKLAEAGYPGGKGMPTIEIQFNTSDDHKAIAELIQAQWRKYLSIRVSLRNQEWASHLSSQQRLDYQVSRAGWIGDYLDPNTFLDMFVTGGANNQTGWSNTQYDALIQGAAAEPDPQQRLRMLHEAEVILMDELPVIPIYYRVSKNMVRPYVKGFYPNVLDVHPVRWISIDQEQKKAFYSQRSR
jgi:oligopeptide transport system substrate-binding protein